VLRAKDCRVATIVFSDSPDLAAPFWPHAPVTWSSYHWLDCGNDRARVDVELAVPVGLEHQGRVDALVWSSAVAPQHLPVRIFRDRSARLEIDMDLLSHWSSAERTEYRAIFCAVDLAGNRGCAPPIGLVMPTFCDSRRAQLEISLDPERFLADYPECMPPMPVGRTPFEVGIWLSLTIKSPQPWRPLTILGLWVLFWPLYRRLRPSKKNRLGRLGDNDYTGSVPPKAP
jgi:hypothetical protein